MQTPYLALGSGSSSTGALEVRRNSLPRAAFVRSYDAAFARSEDAAFARSKAASLNASAEKSAARSHTIDKHAHDLHTWYPVLSKAYGPSVNLDLKRELAFQLIECSRLLRNHTDQRAKEHGTTRAQWIVLWRLRQREGLSQVDLAEVLELQPISLVRLLDRLVELKLLQRRPNSEDRRANRLFLTAAGRRLVDDLDSLGNAIVSEVLGGIAVETLRTTIGALAAIKDRIKAVPAPTGPGRLSKRPETKKASRSRIRSDR